MVSKDGWKQFSCARYLSNF